MTDSKPRTVWLAGTLAAVLVAAAAGGWGLGLWAQRGDQTGAVPSGQRSGVTPGGQRSGQPPRPQQLGDVLPPAGRWRWWKDEDVQKEVGLSAAQVQRIDAIVKERETALASFIKEWFHQRDVLRQMALERRAGVDEFAVQAARFDALDSKLSESRNVMLYRMSRELTDEQYRKLQEVRDRRFGRGNGRGNTPNR